MVFFQGTSATLHIENRVFAPTPFVLHATTSSAIPASPFLTHDDMRRWALSRSDLHAEELRVDRAARLWKRRSRGMLGRRLRSERKAKRLLESCLTPEQRDQLARCGWFKVRVGERTYRIKNSPPSNVELLGDDGHPVKRYCIAPAEPLGRLPFGDVMLAQKLLLEADESEFLSIANAQPPWLRAGERAPNCPTVINLDPQAEQQWLMQIRATRYRCMIEPCGGELIEEDMEDEREHVRRCHPDLTTVRAGGGASGSVSDMQDRGDGGHAAAPNAQRVA